MDDTYDLGARLKERRKAAGLTQKTVCERLGIKASTLRTYEKNKTPPPADKLRSMAVMYGTSVDYLFNLEDCFLDINDDLPKSQKEIIITAFQTLVDGLATLNTH